jgi:hypothetical protein
MRLAARVAKDELGLQCSPPHSTQCIIAMNSSRRMQVPDIHLQHRQTANYGGGILQPQVCDFAPCWDMLPLVGAVRSLLETLLSTSRSPLATTNEWYKYEAIDQTSNAIRLLLLAPGAKPDPVSYRIIVAKLPSILGYIDIFYTWTTEDGDSSSTKSISVCDKNSTTMSIMRVTTNCEAALRRVRHSAQANFVWIDSVCID